MDGKGWSADDLKTKAGRRTIKLGEGTLQVLRDHRERQELQKKIMKERWKENGLIFPCTVGTPGDQSNLQSDFNNILTRAGVPKIRFHDLRHTAASLMLNHKVPIIVVSKILGHSKPSITMDIYGHLYHEMKNEASVIMDKLVTPIQVHFPLHSQNVARS